MSAVIVRLPQEKRERLKALAQARGIYSGRINAESDLGIVWKAAAIRELVASIR